ncbi:hypothetical protein FHS15_005168 [Paenibacillus castaneae]|uniref:hypothetical protein n=1 Tax=Paenibacillus castaneae TaxID=474957 RepID=UPI000C9C56EE|nr:hypothetical protein [Paenibacillus castaneae]NIK79984.1 hypothetical protein [Paenibacillus castaneae]
MKKIIIPILFIGILSLFACQAKTKDLTFVGEGDQWSAVLTVNQNAGDEKYQIQLSYKGDKREEIKAFSYNAVINDYGMGFGANDATLNKENKYQNKSFGSNSPSTSKEDEPVIEVEWNNKSESFTLLNKNM